jgi:hypothetical protein
MQQENVPPSHTSSLTPKAKFLDLGAATGRARLWQSQDER